jgi:hypothetical protein
MNFPFVRPRLPLPEIQRTIMVGVPLGLSRGGVKNFPSKENCENFVPRSGSLISSRCHGASSPLTEVDVPKSPKNIAATAKLITEVRI